MEAEIQGKKIIIQSLHKCLLSALCSVLCDKCKEVSKVNRISSLLCVYDLAWGNDTYT